MEPDEEEHLLPFLLAGNRCDFDTINELVRAIVSLCGRVKDSSCFAGTFTMTDE